MTIDKEAIRHRILAVRADYAREKSPLGILVKIVANDCEALLAALDELAIRHAELTVGKLYGVAVKERDEATAKLAEAVQRASNHFTLYEVAVNDRNEACTELEDALTERDDATAKLAELRAALEYYAEGEQWSGDPSFPPDGGCKARQALTSTTTPTLERGENDPVDVSDELHQALGKALGEKPQEEG